MSAQLIQVIEVVMPRGKGVVGDPYRLVTQYYSTDGDLLAERDFWKEEQEQEEQEHFNWKIGANTCSICGKKVKPLEGQMAERETNGDVTYYHHACWADKVQRMGDVTW